MTPPKWAITVTPFSKMLALIIFVTFPIIGFILGIQYQKLVSITQHDEIVINNSLPSPTASPVEKNKEEIFVINKSILYSAGSIIDHGKKDESLGNKYEINVLPGWHIQHEWTNYSDELYLTNTKYNSYQVSIRQGGLSGITCNFADIPMVTDEPNDYYKTFIDLTDNSGYKYRRTDFIKTGIDSVATQNDLCQFKIEDNKYVSYTTFGSITYHFPEVEIGVPSLVVDTDLLLQMDTMVKSITEK